MRAAADKSSISEILSKPCRVNLSVVQAMAGFGGGSGGVDISNAVPLGAETSQQTLLRYPVRTGPEFDRVVTLMQRTMCSWPSHTSGGTAVVQAGWTYRHRAAKAQPGGRAARLGGAPGIASRRRPRMAPCTVEASRPLV